MKPETGKDGGVWVNQSDQSENGGMRDGREEAQKRREAGEGVTR